MNLSNAYINLPVLSGLQTNESSVTAKDISDDFRFLKLVCVTFISLMIIICNILNIFVVSKTKYIPRITRICLLNLSLGDLLVGLVSCLPCSVAVILDRWPYGAIWCQTAGIVHGSSVTISIWSLSLVSIDRYLAIKHPLRYRYILTAKRTYLIIIVMWVCSVSTFFSPLATKPSFIYYQYSSDERICGLYWEYKWFCVITAICIPIASGAILVFTNASVVKKVMWFTNKTNAMSRSYTNARSNDIRAVKMLIIASIVYFVLWGPYVIQVVTISLLDIDTVPGNVRFITMWLANSNSFTNVFVYSFMYRSFRADIKALISSVFCLPTCLYKRQHSVTMSAERSYQMAQYG